MHHRNRIAQRAPKKSPLRPSRHRRAENFHRHLRPASRNASRERARATGRTICSRLAFHTSANENHRPRFPSAPLATQPAHPPQPTHRILHLSLAAPRRSAPNLARRNLDGQRKPSRRRAPLPPPRRKRRHGSPLSQRQRFPRRGPSRLQPPRRRRPQTNRRPVQRPHQLLGPRLNSTPPIRWVNREGRRKFLPLSRRS